MFLPPSVSRERARFWGVTAPEAAVSRSGLVSYLQSALRWAARPVGCQWTFLLAAGGLRATSHSPPAKAPAPSLRAAEPEAKPLRAGHAPPDLRGLTPRYRPLWKTPQPSHKACERPRATGPRP